MADQNALLAALLMGGNRYGGKTFGGNRYGGNKYGGAQFGASAPQSVAVPSSPPQLPPYQQPGQTSALMPSMPSPTAMQALQPQTAPRGLAATPLAPPVSPPTPIAVPPMPASVQVGQPSPQPSALADVWQTLLKMKGQDPNTPNPWAQNFGNLGDQRG